jgi:hypothetical protein
VAIAIYPAILGDRRDHWQQPHQGSEQVQVD